MDEVYVVCSRIIAVKSRKEERVMGWRGCRTDGRPYVCF